MARTRTIRHGLEAVLFLLGQWIVPLFPRRFLVAFSRAAGWIGFAVARGQRRIALANLDVVYGDSLSKREKEAIVLAAFRSFALLACDFFWFSRRTEARLRRWVRFDDSCRHCLQTRPAVLTGPHLGNWEIVGQALALRGHGWTSVVLPLKNPWVDARIAAMRRRTGQNVVPRAGAVRRLLAVLRGGGQVALLIDQNTKPSDGGVFVEFFGLPAPVSKAAAALAIRTGTPVVLVHCLPERDGGYRAFASEPVVPPQDKDRESEFTRALVERLEALIRSAPGHWLWMYKRWKYIPSGADPARYPFYAKSCREALR